MSESKLATVAPWAIAIGGGFLLLKMLEGFGPKVGQSAGQALGGTAGGLVEGIFSGLGSAIGLTQDTSPIQVVENLPVDAGGARRTGKIVTPSNGSTVSAGIYASAYPVTAEIQWNEEKACIVSFESEEYPRAMWNNAVSRKQSTVKMQPGRNIVSVRMPITANRTLGLDIVLKMSVDGEPYDSVAVYSAPLGLG